MGIRLRRSLALRCVFRRRFGKSRVTGDEREFAGAGFARPDLDDEHHDRTNPDHLVGEAARHSNDSHDVAVG